MGVSNETKNVIAWEFLRKIKNTFLFPLVNPIQGHRYGVCTVASKNSGRQCHFKIWLDYHKLKKNLG
jgi:hypothetical protein